MRLTDRDRAMLAQDADAGTRLAMRLLLRAAEMLQAQRLIDISWAHVASAYDSGPANAAFAERLATAGTRVSVRTTLTACSVDPLTPREPAAERCRALALIELYRGMGCDAVLTCAPYHLQQQPALGQQLAWSESSAVVYANSLLGARSNRYVEFLDMCAAITGRVPDHGLHRDESRLATLRVELREIPEGWLRQAWFYEVLGILVGQESGDAIPALTGLPADCEREHLRAFGSAAAAAGSLAMFHAIGVTPEAPTERDAFGGRPPQRTLAVDAMAIVAAARGLSSHAGEPLSAVCLGTPHFSAGQFRELDALLGDRRITGGVRMLVATSGQVLRLIDAGGLADSLEDRGVEIVTGRCTYYRPSVLPMTGRMMTSSAKWAWYAPASLGVPVSFADLATCVESACTGRALDPPWESAR